MAKPNELRRVEALENIGKQLERMVEVHKEHSRVMLGAVLVPVVENDESEARATELSNALDKRLDEI